MSIENPIGGFLKERVLSLGFVRSELDRAEWRGYSRGCDGNGDDAETAVRKYASRAGMRDHDQCVEYLDSLCRDEDGPSLRQCLQYMLIHSDSAGMRMTCDCILGDGYCPWEGDKDSGVPRWFAEHGGMILDFEDGHGFVLVMPEALDEARGYIARVAQNSRGL